MQTKAWMDWLQTGGWMMYPILLCSLVGLAVSMERGVVLLLINARFTSRVKRLRKTLLKDSNQEPPRNSGAVPPALRSWLAQVQAHWQATPERLQDALMVEGHEVKRGLEAHLNTLSVISQVTPLMGLLGTVTGMVKAFLAVEQSGGIVDPSLLAGGIWEALLTTVFGLFVAIPAYLVWHGMERIVDERLEALEELTEAVLITHEEGRGGE